MAINRVALLFFWIPISSFSQDRYFVGFKDKANTPYSVSNPLQFLSQKSIDRRVRENFPVIEEDFPVDTAYIHKVKKTGASVFFTSRWFNGVLIQTDATIASTVSALPFVSKVELVAPKAKLIGGRRNASNKFEQTNSNAADLLDQFQLQMIGLDKMHEAGYHGEGVDIAVLDAGFIGVDTITGFKPLYNEGRLKSVFNFVTNTANVYTDHYHCTNTLSILAGNIPGKFLGGAYQANFFLYQTEDVRSEYRIEEDDWAFAAERADSAGVDVISSSLGYFQFDD